MRDREIEIDAKELEYNITKKEFAIIKQKYQLTHSSYFSHANGTGPRPQDSDAGKENIPINHDLEHNKDQHMLLEPSLGMTGTAGRSKAVESAGFDRDSLEKFPKMKKYYEESSDNMQVGSESKMNKSKNTQKKFEKKMNNMLNKSYIDQMNEPALEDGNAGGMMDVMSSGITEEKLPFNRERSEDFSKKFATSSFEGASNRKKVKKEYE